MTPADWFEILIILPPKKIRLTICRRYNDGYELKSLFTKHECTHHSNDIAHIDGEAIDFPGLFKHFAGVKEREPLKQGVR